jgi:hypothetical protein
MLIPRYAEPTLRKLAKGFPIPAITGPRQSGTTTSARTWFADKPYASLVRRAGTMGARSPARKRVRPT